jgi:hypothetical protein
LSNVEGTPLTPRWVWRGALGGLALAAALVGTGALVLARGAADLPVIGPLQLDVGFDATSGTAWLRDAGEQRLWDARALPVVSALTVEATAALEAGPPGASYGFWLWHCDGTRQKVFALDGEGYVAWFAPDEMPPWTWFVHARPAPVTNRLRLHLDAGRLTLYVNGEIVTQDESAGQVAPVCAVGLYAAAEDAGGARVRFDRLRVWYAPNSD